jgi:hypothetical protein
LQSATASVTAQHPGGTDFLGLFPRLGFGTPLILPLSRRPDRYTDAARLSPSRSHSSPRVPGSPSSRLHRYPPLPRQVISGNTSSGLYADESNHLPVPPSLKYRRHEQRLDKAYLFSLSGNFCCLISLLSIGVAVPSINVFTLSSVSEKDRADESAMKKLSSDSRRTRLVGKWRSTDDRQVFEPPQVLVCSRHPFESGGRPLMHRPFHRLSHRIGGEVDRQGTQSPSPKEPIQQRRHRFVPS